MTLKADLRRPNVRGAFDTYYRYSIQRAENAAVRAVTRGGRMATSQIRGAGRNAGLGTLMQAVKDTPDRAVRRRGAEGFSVSSTLAIRTGSKRTRGAIEAYTEGATILPRRGRWLWFPTDEASRVVGSGLSRRRLTPEVYREIGEPMGPLFRLRSINGYPLLAVKNVGKSEVGARRGRVRPLTKSGRPRKGDRLKAIAVLFVGIPKTARAARIDPRAILRDVQLQLPALWREEMSRG